MSEEEKVEYDKDSLAGELAAAFDDAQETEDVEVEPAVLADEDTVDDEVEHDTTEASAGESDDEEAVRDLESEAGEGQGGESAGVDEPPSSLPPAAREAWKDAPQAIKDAVAKREKDYEAGIVKYAENAKRAQQMDSVLQPYQQYLATNGGPGNAIKTLLNTGATLQGGSPTQKAAMVAGIIKNFGVDIQALDNLLVGQAPAEDPNAPIQQAVQQAVAPYQQALTQLQQQQAAEQQKMTQGVNDELTQFAATHEFYKDVSADMADIMDMSAKRGLNPSLEEVYNKACMLHPEISTIIQSRNAGAQTRNKKRAAVSITGAPGGVGADVQPDSLTDTLNAAWDAVGRS